ncbi:amino acid adenylation domain-containing protein/thioester reductase domain-containing protein, partial [Asanoa hainanensis]
GLQFRVEFATDLFDRSRVHRLMSHLELVLRAAVADPSTRVSQVPLVVGEERDRMLSDWQGQHVEQTTDPVHTQIAAIHPDVVAARFQGAELTYGELDNRAGILARHLRQLGVGHQDVVAVGLERGFDLLVALVGVLKTGAAFVVMDTSHPQQRLAFVLSDTAAKVVLTTSTLQPRLPEPDGWSPLRMDTDWATIEHAAAEPLPELADENSLAYVLYTSGSTGKPKGVMIEHHALTTFTIWLRNLFHFGPGTRMAHHMAMIFDFAVGEIFTGLVSGATLVFVPEEARLSPPALGDLLLDEHINYLGGPPAVLGAIPPHPYPELTYMIAGGEAVPPDLVNRWNTAPRRFINGYGPTEAAVGCIYHECEHRTWTEQPPIGRPMPRRVAYVFDQWDNLCPVGIPGEVVVGAAGLARGYLNLPELTAEKFIPDPLNPNQRLYRTGDLGVWNETGTIEFLGRIDTQIKLNGLRIELEEIESTLTTHPHITAAAVTVREDTPGNKQLVGYIVPTNGTINTTDLRTHLAEHLPRYMIPNIFVTLPKLPLTTIGKIDRNALPHPEQHTTTRTPITPRTPTEQTITDTFTETLGLPNISVDDNFFALGGTSLQAARTVLALREVTGRDVALTLLYTKPTIRDLAAALDESAGTTTSKAVAAVRETASPAALPPRAPTRFQHILLTGATGYFGAFLLDELLSGTDGTVTCLVRPVRGQRAADRVIANLARFGRHRDDLAERVRVREGDLTRQRLGLSEDEFARLAAQLDVIVHSGAHVDILFPYEGLEGANVDGTRRIIELATTGQLKELLLVSTVSARLGEHRDPSLPGYAASKWAAERLVVAARDRGAPASVFRLPRIAGDSRTGLSNDRDAVMGLLRRFLAMGVAADLRFEEEWVPADLGARALVASASRRSDGGLFTIDPPTRVRVNEVIALLAERAGLPVLPRAEFMDHIAARFPDQLELMKGILATGSRTDLPAPSAEVDKGFERVEAGGPDERLLRRYVDALVTSVGNQPADMK